MITDLIFRRNEERFKKIISDLEKHAEKIVVKPPIGLILVAIFITIKVGILNKTNNPNASQVRECSIIFMWSE